jgi:hypothetical protein
MVKPPNTKHIFSNFSSNTDRDFIPPKNHQIPSTSSQTSQPLRTRQPSSLTPPSNLWLTHPVSLHQPTTPK